MAGAYVCSFILTILCLGQTTLAAESEVLFKITLGEITGRRIFVDGKPVLQFLKVPYAQARINNLRFKKPVAINSWTERLQATQYGPSCSQNQLSDNLRFIKDKNVETSEDCLYLNIYIPEVGLNQEDKLPVLVWIHGGSFLWGQGMRNDGSRLALGGNAIIITVNYRIGVFGFLSTNDPQLPGNYGLWDLHMSLKWINSYIGDFGGDSSNVTVFGQSAGGMALSALSISPVNKGLFKRAIVMSGPLHSPLAISNSTRARKFGERFINSMNCSGEGDNKTIEFTMKCLRKLSPKSVVDKVDTMSSTSSLAPVVDFDFIPGPVDKLLKDHTSEAYKFFSSLDLMIGGTNAEGSVMYFRLVGVQQKFNFNITVGFPRRVLCDYLIPTIVKIFYQNIKQISEEMCTMYSTDSGESDEQSRMAITMYTDWLFWAPTLKHINAHKASKKASFLYLFSHQVEYGLTPYRTDARMPWIRGANHADEVYILFGPEYVYPSYTKIDETDKRISSTMIKYWSNFAKYGNPNGDPNKQSSLLHWPKYDDEEKYLNINSTISVGKSIFQKRMNFWLKRIPEIIKEVSSSGNSLGGLIEVNICAIIAFMLIHYM